MNCPGCHKELEAGFSHRSSPLSFITGESIQKYVHTDEDLNQAGLKVVLPSQASYNAAFHCRTCKILVVDYSQAIPSITAKKQAALLTS